jgi:SAM-dependent methyltransferase
MLVRGDVTRLPFVDNLAKGAILVATLHHLTTGQERLAALKETRRCLINEGKCLLGVWAKEQPKFAENIERARAELGVSWEPGDMLLDWKLPDGRVFPRYYHLFCGEEFSELIARSGFSIERKYFSCDNHYALLVK